MVICQLLVDKKALLSWHSSSENITMYLRFTHTTIIPVLYSPKTQSSINYILPHLLHRNNHLLQPLIKFEIEKRKGINL